MEATFGTRWLQASGDIYKLSKILGLSSVAVTEAHYAHPLKEALVAASQQVKIAVAPRPGGNVRQAAAVAERGTELRKSSCLSALRATRPVVRSEFADWPG